MYSFSDIDYDAATQSVTLGTGLVWDDVYTTLEEYGVVVVGPIVTGIGVGGVTLGGGTSFRVWFPMLSMKLILLCVFNRVFIFD
jgi:FAD/FMN-containing dehydrogenase